MKPELLLIAGWAHTATALDPLAQALGSRFQTRTTSVDRFIPADPLDPAPSWLLGWSLGGMLALECALLQPDRVQGLILVNTTARFTRSADWLHGTPPAELRQLGRALRQDLASGIRGFLELSAQHLLDPDHRTEPLPHRLEYTLHVLQEGLRYLNETDLRPRLGSLRCPVHILHAREDAVIPFAAGQALASAIDGSTFTALDGIGHDLPVRDPARIALALDRYLT